MALSNGITLRGGVKLTDSYVNVKGYSFLKKENKVLIDLNFYKSTEDYETGSLPVQDSEQIIVSGPDFDLFFKDSVYMEPGVTPLNQCYKYLVSTDKYSGFKSV